MQNGETDRIRQLIEAARADERARLETQNILKEINERLSAIESFRQGLAREVELLRGIVQVTHSNVNTLAQLLAAMWSGDRAALAGIQSRLTDLALETSAIDRDIRDISIRAGGDVELSADKVGRDKKDD